MLERQKKKRHTVEKIKDHNSEDNSPHLLKHARENGRAYVWEKDFQIWGNNVRPSCNQKISESLL